MDANGVKNLCEAIVYQAMYDITHDTASCIRNRASAIHFLGSDYCEALTGIDGRYILNELRRKGYAK